MHHGCDGKTIALLFQQLPCAEHEHVHFKPAEIAHAGTCFDLSVHAEHTRVGECIRSWPAPLNCFWGPGAPRSTARAATRERSCAGARTAKTGSRNIHPLAVTSIVSIITNELHSTAFNQTSSVPSIEVVSIQFIGKRGAGVQSIAIQLRLYRL